MDLLKGPRVDIRNTGYYLPGIRFSLESIAYGLRQGQTVNEILDDFPDLKHFLGPRAPEKRLRA